MKKLLTFFILVLSASAPAFGDLPTAQFLLVNQGARSTAMGGAVVSNCLDYSSNYWNPAASAFMDKTMFGFGGSQLPAGITSGYLSVAAGPNPDRTVGFGMDLIYQGANVPAYDINGSKLSDINAFDFAYRFSLAFKIGEHFAFSPTLGFLAMNIDKYYSDLAFNMGLSSMYTYNRFSAGLVFANMGSQLQFTDSSGNSIGDAQPQPQLTRYGASYSLFKNKNLLLAYAHQDVNGDTAASWSSLGVEWYLSKVIALRGGSRNVADGSTVQSLGVGLNFQSVVFEIGQTMAPSDLDGINMTTFDLQFKFAPPSNRAASAAPAPVQETRTAKRGAMVQPEAPAAAEPVAAAMSETPRMSPLPQGSRPTIAVSELTGKGVSGMEASVVSDFLRDAMTNTNAFNLVERSSMEQVLSEQKFQMSGCTSDECAVKMGKILNVQRMILGSFSKLGDTYYVSVRMVDVEKGMIITAETINAGNMNDVQPACIELANRLATGRKGEYIPSKQTEPQISNQPLLEQTTIAVMNLSATEGIPSSDAAAISELLRTAIISTNKFSVVERGQIEKVVSEQGFQQTGVTDQNMAIKIGEMLNAKKVVLGSVSKLGSIYLINIRMVDVKSGKAEYADKGEATTMENTRFTTEDMANRLAAQTK